MDKLKSIVVNQLEELKKIEKLANRDLGCEIQGKLKVCTKKNKPYYYLVRKNSHGKYEYEYISKKNEEIYRQLAQKEYAMQIKSTVEKNIKLLEHMLRMYDFEGVHKKYSAVAEGKRSLITPYYSEVECVLEKWENEEYLPNPNYQDGLRYETDKGELVRSKSEVIIANLLNQYSEYIDYRYEEPLNLVNHLRIITIYPDFTIINKKTGQIKYLEHAGMMAEQEYVEDFIWKYNLYIANHILPGKDILFTFESENSPLNIQMLKIIGNELMK